MICSASAEASRSAPSSMPVVSATASKKVTRRQGEVKSSSPCVVHGGGGPARDLLQALGLAAVVGVGLVPLDHRELGVVLGREALVAEVLAQLVDPLQPAHQQPLEVQLGRDPQIQVAVERVVVGGERPCQGAAVERLQDRRLDLHEAVLVQVGAHRRDDAGTVDEQPSGRLVRDQVELAPAQPRLHVAEPVVLLGRRAQGLGEHHEGVHPQGQLAVAAAQGGAVDADQIAAVERRQALEGVLAEHVLAGVELDLAAAVNEVEEARPAAPADRQDASGHAVAVVGLLAGLQVLVVRQHPLDRLDVRELVGEGLGVGLPQPLTLGAALLDQLLQAVTSRLAGRWRLLGCAHARGEPTRGRRRSW